MSLNSYFHSWMVSARGIIQRSLRSFANFLMNFVKNGILPAPPVVNDEFFWGVNWKLKNIPYSMNIKRFILSSEQDLHEDN